MCAVNKGFYCSPRLSTLYNATICTLSAITFLTTVLPYFRHFRFRALKTYLFLSIGFAGVVPLAHLVYHMGYIHFIVWYLCAMGGFYVVGAMVYLFQIPGVLVARKVRSVVQLSSDLAPHDRGCRAHSLPRCDAHV